ncbi:MAG TPA: hypothetical protein VM509_00255 [Planctomycetota bacterium]|nr:hypothetical protein [Planctomycetota bacterium]
MIAGPLLLLERPSGDIHVLALNRELESSRTIAVAVQRFKA